MTPTTTPPVKTNPQPKPSIPKKEPVLVRVRFERESGEPEPITGSPTEVPMVNSNSIAKRAAGLPWNVLVDGLPAAFQFEGVPLTDNIPSASQEQHRHVIFGGIGPVAALGAVQDGKSAKVVDLRNRAEIGKITGLAIGKTDFVDLSIDGKYFLANPEGTDVIGVYDVIGETALGVVSIDPPGFQFVSFAGRDKFVHVMYDTISIVSVPDLRDLKSTAAPYSSFQNVWNVSPGGATLVYASKDNEQIHLNFLDTKNLNLEGRLLITGEVDRIGTGFSHDGRELAVAFSKGDELTVQVWDLSNGTLVSESVLNNSDAETLPSQITVRWFPDARKILIADSWVYDIAKKSVLAKHARTGIDPYQPAPENRMMMIRSDRLVVQDAENTSTPKPTVTTTPSEEPATGSSSEFDAGLPALTRAKRSTMETKKLGGERTSWGYIPRRPRKNTAKLLNRPIPLSTGSIYRADVACDDWGYAAVCYSDVPFSPSTKNGPDNNSSWIEAFELRTGTKKPKVEFPFSTMLEDLDPDANTIVTRAENGLDRLDLWTLKKGEHIAGFRPYQSESDPTGSAVDYVQFVDGEHLLTRSNGMLTYWEIPDCRAIWEVPVGEMKPVIVPARDSAIVSSEDGTLTCFIDLKSGNTTSVIKGNAPLTGATVSSDGEILVTSRQKPGGCLVSVTDLGIGKQRDEFMIPGKRSGLRWLRDDIVLVNNSVAVSLKYRAIVWQYQLEQGLLLDDPVDGRCWFLVANSAGDQALNSVSLPHSTLLNQLKKGAMRATMVLSDGGDISVNSEIASQNVDVSQLQIALEGCRQNLRDLGFDVSSGRSMSLTVRGSETPKNAFLVGKLIGAVPENVKVPELLVSEMELQLTLTMEQDGNVYWSKTITTSNQCEFEFDALSSIAELEEQANQTAMKSMWEDALKQISQANYPSTLFTPEAATGLGTSSLTDKGLEDH